MTFTQLLESAPGVLMELTGEFTRRGDQAHSRNKTSQETACFFLAIRSASLLFGMSRLLSETTSDSYEALTRSFMESRDLLLTFRFDDGGTRTKIGHWFSGTLGSSWKADHKRCADLIKKLSQGNPDLAKRWSMYTALSHPTVYAATNSVNTVVFRARPRPEYVTDQMRSRLADYLVSISTLIIIATLDLPGLIPLGFEGSRMHRIDSFHEAVQALANPILARTEGNALPADSYRSK
jgi:hypothetical protein